MYEFEYRSRANVQKHYMVRFPRRAPEILKTPIKLATRSLLVATCRTTVVATVVATFLGTVRYGTSSRSCPLVAEAIVCETRSYAGHLPQLCAEAE
eukprot:scaffold363909_cov20-Prasinocladus_malaysianus.AAC.1